MIGYLKNKIFRYCQVLHLNQVFYTDNDLLYYDNRTLKERFPIKEPKARGKKTGGIAPVKSLLEGNYLIYSFNLYILELIDIICVMDLEIRVI